MSGVRLGFGGQRVLDGMDLTVDRGTNFVIMGLSGSGKSVTLKLLSGLLKAEAGEIRVGPVRVDGADRKQLAAVRSRMGFVFQSAALIAWMTAAQNVALPLRERGVSAKEARERAVERMEAVGLDGVADKFPSELSGGMRKRVGFARAMILDPELVLFDEPTTGLDPRTTRTIDELVIRARDDFGSTGVIVSHDVSSTLRVADRIGILHGGRLELVVSPDEFVRSDHPLVRDFLSSNDEGRPVPPRSDHA